MTPEEINDFWLEDVGPKGWYDRDDAVDAQMRSDLTRGGCAPYRLAEVGAGLRELLVQILEPAWNFHRPPVVAEVATHFAHDRGHREREEIRTTIRIETIHRVQ